MAAPLTTETAAAPPGRAARGRRGWAKLLRLHPMAFVGFVIVLAWIVVAALAPWIATHEPNAQNLSMRNKPPSAEHWFGTDRLGRDVFSRVVWGARVSIPVGIGVVAAATVTGLIIGAVAGFVGGWLDEALMRVSDLVLSFPVLILAMALAAALGPSLVNSTIAIAAVWWPRYARLARGLVIALREQEFVMAATAAGATPGRVLAKTIVPNILAPILVLATLDMGTAILTFASLGFLGLGQVPPDPEWGAMVADGTTAFQFWWVSTFPGLAILTVAMGFNFIGDALRDVLDPRWRHQL
ncbi:MAG: ABC transporter permease [Limnochordales bacterium]|nr:ABC transporter permease [Limnochordales bacterium]